MRVVDFMKREVITVGRNATVREAVRLLGSAGVSGLPVVDDEGRLAGIVTEHDIIRHLMPTYGEILSEEYAVLDIDQIHTRSYQVRDDPIHTIMTRSVVTLSEDDPLVKAASIMLIKKIKRLPVVREGKPVGIVSRIDVLQAVLEGAA